MSRRDRWLAGTGLFLLLVVPSVWVLGSDWLVDHAENLWPLVVVVVIAAYFLLGFVTRSYLSVFLILLPILLIWLFERPVDPDVEMSWTVAWVIYTGPLAFVIVFGVAIARFLERQAREVRE